MKNKQEHTQRVLDNHGNITQNGDIIEFKNSKIENINNILIQNLEKEVVFKYKSKILINSEEIFLELLKLNHNNFKVCIIYNDTILTKNLNNNYLHESKICLQLEKEIIKILNKSINNSLKEKYIKEFICFAYNFNKLFDLYYDSIKNHNINLLKLFFDCYPYNGVNWNYTNLRIFLKEQPSNLIIDNITNIEEIFQLGYDGYFRYEDEKEWSNVEEYYHHTRYEYLLKLKEDEILSLEIEGLEDFFDCKNKTAHKDCKEKYEYKLYDLEMKIFDFEQDRKYYDNKKVFKDEESQLEKDLEELMKKGI